MTLGPFGGLAFSGIDTLGVYLGLDTDSPRVHTYIMNIIRNTILDLAGGSMNTAALNTLTMLVFAILFIIAGVACAYVMAALTAQYDEHMTVDKVSIITDAQ